MDDQDRSSHETFSEVLAKRLSRRQLLVGLIAAGAATMERSAFGREAETAPQSSLRFEEVPHGTDGTHHVPRGYRADVLLRWGDPILPDAQAFDPSHLTAVAQLGQFGTNCDYLAFLPLPYGSGASDHGLLFVNHEHTCPTHMWPDADEQTMTRERTEVELAAIGCSVVEIRRVEGSWTVVQGSLNRRIDALGTEILLSGPAAGHPRVRTSEDPTGRRVLGTLANCSGGKTPWGTVLSGEENFHKLFAGDPARTPEAHNHARYRLGTELEWPWWGRHFRRFDVEQEPNEPNRFGWVVEVDPYDPAWAPRKRTALGRLRHECATTTLCPDGRLAVFSGDDERYHCIWRFVTRKRVGPDRESNRDLLDDGTLSVARFEPDGTLRWLPVVHGTGPLTTDNGFVSQADVLIEARRAADLLGATRMDRPEDVETNPVTGVVYAMLTGNDRRTEAERDPANPRAGNAWGHVIAMVPPGTRGQRDHAADTWSWELPLLAGAPDRGRYPAGVSRDGWFVAPDNCAFDPRGRLWIATDQGSAWTRTGFADGLYACDVEGPAAYRTRQFLRVPVGAETTGPELTPDGRTLFVSVQHPAVDVEGSTYEAPATRWPDFRAGVPPRASILAVTRDDGGAIGG